MRTVDAAKEAYCRTWEQFLEAKDRQEQIELALELDFFQGLIAPTRLEFEYWAIDNVVGYDEWWRNHYRKMENFAKLKKVLEDRES